MLPFYSFAYIKKVKYMEEMSEKIFLKKIGEKLKFYRKKAGYSNYEYFAYDNNISRPQYGKYEAGANIQLNTLYKILKALKVTPEEFFKGID
jgi:transcriptional regulator with XRE-family HTH domain